MQHGRRLAGIRWTWAAFGSMSTAGKQAGEWNGPQSWTWVRCEGKERQLLAKHKAIRVSVTFGGSA